jgi:hypothetical protein
MNDIICGCGAPATKDHTHVLDDLDRHEANATENVRRGFGGAAYLPSHDTLALIAEVRRLRLALKEAQKR